METQVIIVGAGASGLATGVCLKLHNIPFIILEKDDCNISLWRRKTYDRLKLHLAKNFCAMPHKPYSKTTPNFIPKNCFINYIDEYVKEFQIEPIYNTKVVRAGHDDNTNSWCIRALNMISGEVFQITSLFLVVATGENAEGFIPGIPGVQEFDGEILHSSQYRNGGPFSGKDVLVVGCGNSGMEIAYDLCNAGAKTSIVVRSPFHVVTKEIIWMGMALVKYVPVGLLDPVLVFLAKMIYGDLSKYGIERPNVGPLTLKGVTGRSAVIDVGTIGKIKAGEIKVVKELMSIKGNELTFADGTSACYNTIVFATGYKRITNIWLQNGESLLKDDGFPINDFPNHCKGAKGLYCVGFARRGLAGVSFDAQFVADDIHKSLKMKNM